MQQSPAPNIVIEFKKLKTDEAKGGEDQEVLFCLKGDTILYGCCFGGKVVKVVSEELTFRI